MMKWFRAFRAEIFRELQETYYYRTNLIGDLVVQIFLFGALILLGGYSSVGAKYGVDRSDTRSLVLLGYLFWSYSAWAISQMGSDVAAEALKGTLEYKFTSVAPPALLLGGKALGSMITSTGFVLLVVTIIVLFFRVPITVTPGAVLALVTTLIGMYGIGFIFAGLALVAKRVSQVVTAFQVILLFITGTLAPPEAMPTPVKWLAESLPLTQGIHLARLSIVHAVSSPSAWVPLVVTSAIYVLVGIAIFHVFAHKARAEGLLGRH